MLLAPNVKLAMEKRAGEMEKSPAGVETSL